MEKKEKKLKGWQTNPATEMHPIGFFKAEKWHNKKSCQVCKKKSWK